MFKDYLTQAFTISFNANISAWEHITLGYCWWKPATLTQLSTLS